MDDVIEKRGKEFVERGLVAVVDFDVELVAVDFDGGVGGDEDWAVDGFL